MKISKLTSKRVKGASKAAKTNAIISKNTTVRHKFHVLSADEVNKNRSNAYDYLVF